jgi:hypothetical protein
VTVSTGEEIAGEGIGCLAAKERPPAHRFALRRRLEPSRDEQTPDGARREAEAKLDQLASDPLVAPARVLARAAPRVRAGLGRSADGPACAEDMSISGAPAPDASEAACPAPRRGRAGDGAEAAEQAPRWRHDPAAAASHADSGEPRPRADVAAARVRRPWRTRPVDRERAAARQQRRRGSEGEEHRPILPRRPKAVMAGDSCALQRLLVSARAREPNKTSRRATARPNRHSGGEPPRISRQITTADDLQERRIRVLTPFTA